MEEGGERIVDEHEGNDETEVEVGIEITIRVDVVEVITGITTTTTTTKLVTSLEGTSGENTIGRFHHFPTGTSVGLRNFELLLVFLKGIGPSN